MNKYKVEAIQNISGLFTLDKDTNGTIHKDGKDSCMREDIDTNKFRHRLQQRITGLFKIKRKSKKMQ